MRLALLTGFSTILILSSELANGQAKWLDKGLLNSYAKANGIEVVSDSICDYIAGSRKDALYFACSTKSPNSRFTCVSYADHAPLTFKSSDWKLIKDPKLQGPQVGLNTLGVWHNSCGELVKKTPKIAPLSNFKGKEQATFKGEKYQRNFSKNYTLAEVQSITGDKDILGVASYCMNSAYLIEKCENAPVFGKIVCVHNPQSMPFAEGLLKFNALTQAEFRSITTSGHLQRHYTTTCGEVLALPKG
ncbi:MAG: hypothetical protein EOP04_01915 [Proteobacteria bacterium]|nr:MAG: hypothetical protein EOP04_01915 [Pseudomonadota bacterium]